MKRPMIALAAVWLAGILAGRYGLPGSRLLFLCSYVLVILIFLNLVRHRPSLLFPYIKRERYLSLTLFWLILPLLFCGGYGRQKAYETELSEALTPWQQMEEQGETYVFVTGTVTGKTVGESMTLTLSDCQICGYKQIERQAWKSAGDCRITIDVEGSRETEIRSGNRIRVYGKFYLYDAAGNPGQFDAATYYNGKGLFATVRALRTDVLSSEVSALGNLMFGLKQRMKETLLALYPEEKAGVLSAMLLGDKDLLLDEIKELYQQNGISHILAISGLHISMLCMGFFRVLRRMGMPLRFSAVLALLFLAFYVVFTGAGTSSLRAGIMCIVLIGAKLFRRSYDLLSSLSFAAILVTLIRPQELTSAGFLLSFGAVIGIAVAQTLEEAVSACLKQELPRKTFGSLMFGGMIQLVTVPISLWFYYELSPYSILLNLVILPLASLILGGGLFSVLIGMCCPAVAKLLAGGTYLLLSFYERICQVTQKLPYSFVLVGRPEVWQMVVYYALLSAVLWYGKGHVDRKHQKENGVDCEKTGKEWGTGLKITAGIVVALTILFLPEHPSFELTFLDVSQGDGILLQTDSGEVLLFDGGSTDVSAVGEYRIAPFLKQKGLALIDTVTISHTDSDHYSGVLELLKAMPVYEGKAAFFRDYQGDIGICKLVLPKVEETSEVYLELEALAEEKNVELSCIEAGEVLYEENGLLIECLSPKNAVESENDTSLVFLIQTPELAVWMMGDAGVEAEEAVMKRLGSDARDTLYEKYCILKVGHHGSATSSSEEFIAFVQPDAAVISCGYKNSYGHPHESVLENLADAGCVVYRTDSQGCVRFEADRHGKLQVRGYLPD